MSANPSVRELLDLLKDAPENTLLWFAHQKLKALNAENNLLKKKIEAQRVQLFSLEKSHLALREENQHVA